MIMITLHFRRIRPIQAIRVSACIAALGRLRLRAVVALTLLAFISAPPTSAAPTDAPPDSGAQD